MATKRKNGQYVPCDWCGQMPPNSHPYTYTHTNIHSDPPQKHFCSKYCLERFVFAANHRIIKGFSNLNKDNYIKYNILNDKYAR